MEDFKWSSNHFSLNKPGWKQKSDEEEKRQKELVQGASFINFWNVKAAPAGRRGSDMWLYRLHFWRFVSLALGHTQSEWPFWQLFR